MMQGVPNMKVDLYFEKHEPFRAILDRLRGIILEHPFEETVKWGMPTYVYKGRNLLGIGAFKKHVGLWFFQGALLTDPKGLLRNAQEGKTKAMRQIAFEHVNGIKEEELKELIAETLHNQDQGKFVKIERKSKDLVLPKELSEALSDDPELKSSFGELTPGRQREYAEHIGSAKREQTRMDRLSKAIPLILKNRGLNDKYKK